MPEVLYAYKFRLYPNNAQQALLAKHFGCCRFVYNHFLAKRIEKYENTGKGSTYNQDCLELTKLKKEKEWLREVSDMSLQQSLMNLDAAYKKFFNEGRGFPNFKKKHRSRDSFRIPASFKVDQVTKRLFISKFREGIKIRLHRPIEGLIRSITVSRSPDGRYFASILVRSNMEELPQVDKQVGIDVGLSTFATLSDGTKIGNIRPYKRLEKKLARFQRKWARSKKGSNNREKLRTKIAKIHSRIANIRANFLHQSSHKIVSDNQAIYVEDLNIDGMKKNRKLAKSVSDVSWSEFFNQLEYKSRWRGRSFVKIDRFYPSSKTCSCCGSVKESLGLSERKWQCVACGANHDRDANAATNILIEGKITAARLAVAASGGSIRLEEARSLERDEPRHATLDSVAVIIGDG